MNELEEVNNKSNIFHNKWVVGIVVIITTLLFTISFIPGTGNWIENEYLVTAAAIIPLLYTTVAQHIELGYQRKELNESTKALQGQQQELNETKEINDKHQITNQFFQLLSLREKFNHSTNILDLKGKERLFTLIDFQELVTEKFRRSLVGIYIYNIPLEKKKNLLHNLKEVAPNNEEKTHKNLREELYQIISKGFSAYDEPSNRFVESIIYQNYNDNILVKVIEDIKDHVNHPDNNKQYTREITEIMEDVEFNERILTKHMAYHRSIAKFINSIKYDELQNELKNIYFDLLTEAERFYLGMRMMNTPCSSYIFEPPFDVKLRSNLYKDSIFDLNDE